MNKTTTMTMCIVMLMIGMAFTAVAATRSDSSGDLGIDFTNIEDDGGCNILGESFTVLKGSKSYKGTLFSDRDIVVDMKDVPAEYFANTSMMRLILTDKVETIGEGAFKNSDLISITRLGTGSLTIAKDAFTNCPHLEYIDLRGDVTVDENAFSPGLTALTAMDMDGDEPQYSAGNVLRIKDTGGSIAATMLYHNYSKQSIRVGYTGTGLLQLVDDDGNLVSSTTKSKGYTIYEFDTYSFKGKDLTLGHRTIQVKYNLGEVIEDHLEMDGSVHTLMDPSEGSTSSAWKGWKPRTASTFTTKTIYNSFVNTYCKTSSVLDLVPVTDSYNISYTIESPVEGEAVSSLGKTTGNGTTAYPVINDTEHYSFAGWVRVGDEDATVHEGGSYVGYYADQTLKAVWEPKAEFIFELRYTNVDGTDLGEPESVAYGQKAAVKAVVPCDETPTQMLDGWRTEDGADILREGDTLTVTGDTKLIPVLRDRTDVTVTFDNGGSQQTMTVKEGYPSQITAEDPEDALRLFTGWTMEGTDWALKNGAEVTATGNITLTPTWRDKQEFRVTYMSEGLRIGDQQTVLETDEVRVHADVSRYGHRLDGWSDGADVVDDGSDYRVMRDVTFTAVWIELERYTLTYHLENGTTPSVSAYVGSIIGIDADPGTRQGSEFLGWSTTGGSGAEYSNGDSIEMVADVDLYPVWKQVEEQREDQGSGDGGSSGGDTSGGDSQSGDGTEQGGDSSGDDQGSDGSQDQGGSTTDTGDGDSSGDSQSGDGSEQGGESSGDDHAADGSQDKEDGTTDSGDDGSAGDGDSSGDSKGDGTEQDGESSGDDHASDGSQDSEDGAGDSEDDDSTGDGDSSGDSQAGDGTEQGGDTSDEDSSSDGSQDKEDDTTDSEDGDSTGDGDSQAGDGTEQGGDTSGEDLPSDDGEERGDDGGSSDPTPGDDQPSGDDTEGDDTADGGSEKDEQSGESDGTTDTEPSDDATEDAPHDGSGSGSGGIGTGAGLAVLAGVSALVAGLMVVVLRRS